MSTPSKITYLVTSPNSLPVSWNFSDIANWEPNIVYFYYSHRLWCGKVPCRRLIEDICNYEYYVFTEVCNTKYIYFFLSYSDHFLPSEFRCRRLLLHLITLNDTPHSVGLLWKRDRPVAETYTWQHTTLTGTDIYDPGEIRTRNPSEREAADPRLRPRGHQDWPITS